MTGTLKNSNIFSILRHVCYGIYDYTGYHLEPNLLNSCCSKLLSQDTLYGDFVFYAILTKGVGIFFVSFVGNELLISTNLKGLDQFYDIQ